MIVSNLNNEIFLYDNNLESLIEVLMISKPSPLDSINLKSDDINSFM